MITFNFWPFSFEKTDTLENINKHYIKEQVEETKFRFRSHDLFRYVKDNNPAQCPYYHSFMKGGHRL